MMKKLMAALLALSLLVVSGCGKSGGYTIHDMNEITTDAQKEFDTLQKQWFIEDMESDYLNLHFSLEDPAAMGVTVPEVSLGEVFSDPEDTTYTDRLAKLAEIDPSQLTEDQQIAYQCMEFDYQLSQQLLEVQTDYTFAFTPNSGLNNNLITNFTEFDLRSEQDAADLITLVEDSGRVMDEGIAYTREQAAQGIVQPDSVIEAVQEQCRRFIANTDDNQVITIYNSRIDELDLANAQDYKDRMAAAVTGTLIPAYQRIIEMYDELKGTAVKSGLMADYGADAVSEYELIVRSKTSCSESVAELESELKQAIEDALNLFIENSDVTETDDYGYSDPYDILGHIKEKMANDFPTIPDVSYTIDYLDPSVTSDNVSAYYLIAPYDNLKENVIKVNPTFVESDPNGLCITLGHEGYPGHLFAHTYYFSNHHDDEIRYSLSFLGYGEGWAEYTENLAYGYFLSDAKEVLFEQAYNCFSYYLYAYCDLRMHHDGWGVAELTDYLGNYFQGTYAGMYAESIYDTNLGDPGLFLPYGVGMLKMNQLHDQAASALGKKFDLKEYNTVVLDTGEAPFDVLQQRVDDYLAAAQ